RGAKSSDDAGYRSSLFKLILAAKQKATFTGSLTNGPTQVSGQTFPRMHEGHPGWTIDPGYNTMSSSYSGISSLVPSSALHGNPKCHSAAYRDQRPVRQGHREHVHAPRGADRQGRPERAERA